MLGLGFGLRFSLSDSVGPCSGAGEYRARKEGYVQVGIGLIRRIWLVYSSVTLLTLKVMLVHLVRSRVYAPAALGSSSSFLSPCRVYG